MADFQTEVEAIEIGMGDCSIAFTPVGSCLGVRLRGRGLLAEWKTEPLNGQQLANGLQELHDTLRGNAWLGDNESFGITFTAGTRGQVTADVHVEGWPFKMTGHLDLQAEVEHAQLAGLAKRLRGLAS